MMDVSSVMVGGLEREEDYQMHTKQTKQNSNSQLYNLSRANSIIKSLYVCTYELDKIKVVFFTS